MQGDFPMPWGHSRDLTGTVHSLAVGSTIGADSPPGAARGWKYPVSGPVALTASGLAGDSHADSAHGGPDRAVCVYPWEHYSHWADEYGLTLPAAAFGENVTSMGLLEDVVYVGDVFQWGRAVVQVTGPRRGCATLGVRYGRDDLPSRLELSGRTGFFLRVLSAGTVRPDDRLVLADVDPYGLSVADVNTVLSHGPAAAGLSLERVLSAGDLLPAAVLADLERRWSVASLRSETRPDWDLQRSTG